MRPDVPTPTELREKLTPILNLAYREKRTPSKDEIAVIKEATCNPDVVVTVHRESTVPYGKWCYSRKRDAEKILSLTIWIRAQDTVVKTTETAATATETVKKTVKTVKPKPIITIELATAAIVSEDSTPVIPVETDALTKNPRVKTAKPKVVLSNAPVDPVQPVTITTTPDLEAEALPVTQTVVNSTPTPKPKQESAAKTTSLAPTLPPSTEGQLSLW